MRNEQLDLPSGCGNKRLEGSAPSKMEEPTSNVSARGVRNVGVLAIWNNFPPTVDKGTLWIMGMHLNSLEPHKGVIRDEQP